MDGEAMGAMVDSGVKPDALSALEAKVSELEKALSLSRESLDAAERRHQIDLALVEAEAIDLETARLLTELAVQAMDSKDVRAAVNELKSRKGFLFRSSSPTSGRNRGAMGAREHTGNGSTLRSAAEAAAASGDRGDLLRYLRARRVVG